MNRQWEQQKKRKKRKQAAVLLLKTLEDMLHNKNHRKEKRDIQKSKHSGQRKIMDADRDIAMGIIRESEYQDTAEA